MTVDLYDRALTAMDPAAGVVPRRDPDGVLDDILRTRPEPAPKRARATRPSVRVGLVVAAVTAVAVVIPLFVRGQSAYAGWTAYPAALSTGQESAVARQCQTWAEDSITKAPTNVVLSERRGDIGLALLTGPDGLLVTCQQTLGGSGEPSGGSSETYLPGVLARDQILSDGGSGFSEDDDEPIYRVVSGRVGTDITAVVVDTAEQGDVTATVKDGYFTAWWPGPPDTARPPQGSLPMNFTFTARLRDGTTRSFTRAQTQTQSLASAPPAGASALAVLDKYLRALVAGDCATAHAAVAPTFSADQGDLCGDVDVTAFSVREDPATPGPDEVIYMTTLTTNGSSDGSIAPGETVWFYQLERQGGEWRVVSGGTGP